MDEVHEHLEHAEHARHHAADPFDRRVAVTMAIIAAALAGIAMAGHRKHNEVLRLQGDANRLRTESAAASVEKSNNFAWYQSKRNRQAQYEVAATLAELQAGGDAAKSAAVGKWKADVEKYKKELEDLQKEGDKYGREADRLMTEAKAVRDEAEYAHHQADRLDVAHLLAEVALVVCSVAVLTKRKGFWLGGIAAAGAALAVTASAYALPHHTAGDSAHPPQVEKAGEGHS
jgi:Domain of unknown function (DUF4337)